MTIRRQLALGLGLLFVGLLWLALGTPARPQYMLLTGAGKAPSANASYVGPGDIVSFSGWWGLRAYSLATVGTSAVDVQRASDSAICTLVTKLDGTLDLTSGSCSGSNITTFCTATTCTVSKLYDQTGGGRPFTAVIAPLFSQSVLGGFASLRMTGSTEVMTNTTGFGSVAQPWSQSLVFQTVTHVNFTRIFTDSASVEGYLYRNNGANTVELHTGGGFQTITANDGVFHGLNWKANGATSRYTLDNGAATTAPGIGTDSWATGTISLGSNSGAAPDAYIMEFGFLNAGLTDGNLTSLGSNQKSFWGY